MYYVEYGILYQQCSCHLSIYCKAKTLELTDQTTRHSTMTNNHIMNNYTRVYTCISTMLMSPLQQLPSHLLSLASQLAQSLLPPILTSFAQSYLQVLLVSQLASLAGSNKPFQGRFFERYDIVGGHFDTILQQNNAVSFVPSHVSLQQ